MINFNLAAISYPVLTSSLLVIGNQKSIETLPREYNSLELEALLTSEPASNFAWMKQFLQSGLSEEAALFLFQKLTEFVHGKEKTVEPWRSLYRFEERVLQLQSVHERGFEEGTYSFLALLKTALFIETEVMKTDRLFFTAKESGLLWPLQRDGGDRVYLLARYSFSKFRAAGGFKQVALAAGLSLQNRAPLQGPFVHTRLSQAEAAHTLALQGDGVVKVVAECAHGSTHSVVMKKYPTDLFGTIIKRPLLYSERYIIAAKVGQTLGRIHALEYVHGDVKAENIFCEFTRCQMIQDACLADFGGASQKIGQLRCFSGTYENFSPEILGISQFAGDARASDVWAFGCALYRLEFRSSVPWEKLCREFRAKDPKYSQDYLKGLFLQHLHTAHRNLLETPGTVDEMFLRHLIQRMLEVDPVKRISMQMFNQELARLSSDSGSDAARQLLEVAGRWFWSIGKNLFRCTL